MPQPDKDVLRAHERLLADGRADPPGGRHVRGVVAESWRRSMAAGVSADEVNSPVELADRALHDYRAAHVLSPVFPLLYDVLGRAAEDCDTVMAVGDAQGRLLWVCGRPNILRQAEGIQFVEGATWGEGTTGTNAPGLALTIDQPVAIKAAEHFTAVLQQWSCAAAPIHDPVTQEIIGVVDVTGGAEAATVQSLAMVRSAARMAEAELGRLYVVDAAARAAGVPGPASGSVHVESLGRPHCQVTTAQGTYRLSRRHGEILTLLASEPRGAVGEALALEVYGETSQSLSTLRAEMARLRSMLGGDIVQSRPYRLEGSVTSDWQMVERFLDGGDLRSAVQAYSGPLLPQSTAPGVVARREQLELRLRSAILESGSVDLLTTWTRSRSGIGDLDAWEAQWRLLPQGSPLATMSHNEVVRLRIEYGLDPQTGRIARS
ncbi:transcriptional regulator [Janibacter terrae]|uniref:Transcriptional regulator n=1 Tax=Janibacter terrae TaxID=103817 RepID=A0ABZ2FEA4_9MICO